MQLTRKVIAAATAAVALTAVSVAVASTIKPPPSIAKAGKIVWCVDVEYPPEESYDTHHKAVGSDIDIATGMGKLMGVKTEIKNVVFDSIIAALLTKKCDAVISGMNDTPARRKQVDFVDYLKVGQSLMVKKGNPGHISTLESLSGKRVSVQTGTTNRDFLAATSKKLQKAGKKAITIVTFPKDTDAISALKAERVDCYFADSPVVAYYSNLDHGLAIAGQPINPIPIGIAIRKHDPLRAAVQQAVKTLYTTGEMKKIVARWGMSKAVTLLKF